MSVTTEITRLQTAKANIKASIEEKGVQIPSSATLDTYSTYVDDIEGEVAGPYVKSVLDAGTPTGAYQLKKLVRYVLLPSGCTSIPSNEFDACTTLEEIEGGYDVQSIGSNAFRATSHLTGSISFPSLTSISTSAFATSGIEEVLSLGNITSIPNTASNTGQFRACPNLRKIVLPNTLLTIGAHVFRESSNLSDMPLPSSIQSIGSAAFRGTILSGEINLPNYTATTVPGATFYGTRITKVLNLGSIVSFPDCDSNSGVFQNCYYLTEVHLPSTVTSIGTYVFRNCTALTDFFCLATTPPSLASTSFSLCNALANIYVPDASVQDYQNATNWNNYSSKIQGISNYNPS